MKGIDPSSILTNIGLGRWYDNVMAKSQFLAFLIEHIVAIHILESIDTIRTGRYALDDKATTTICTTHTKHWLRLEGRIGLVTIQAHQDTLDRFQVFRLQYITRNFQGINCLTCRKTIGEVTHRIVLIVITDSIRKVDGISCVRL